MRRAPSAAALVIPFAPAARAAVLPHQDPARPVAERVTDPPGQQITRTGTAGTVA